MAAEYDHLPVYKATYDLVQHVYRDKSIASVPRDVKFTLVETLKKDLLEILVSIYKAHYTTDESSKAAILQSARDLLPGIKARFRIMFDLHQLPSKVFQSMAVEVETISKQLTAWHAKTSRRAISSAGSKE